MQCVQINPFGDLTGLTGLGFHIIEVEPGRDTTEYHVHYHEDECVYVLSGTATAYIGGEEYQISEGDFVGYRAGGEAHGITKHRHGNLQMHCRRSTTRF